MFLEKLHHSITFIFKFSASSSDSLKRYFFRGSKGFSFGGVSVRIGNKIIEFFLTFESVDLFVKKCDVLIVFETDFDILSSDFVADGAKIEVL